MIHHRPYAKMADILKFFCVMGSCLCAFKLPPLTSFLSSKMKRIFHWNEASEANLNAHKRILKCQPFLHRVYFISFAFSNMGRGEGGGGLLLQRGGGGLKKAFM